jgi:S-DNA-T family DNA segregation ATPase FtsK/SpoIIIE
MSTPNPHREHPSSGPEVSAVNTVDRADNVVPFPDTGTVHEHPTSGTALEPRVYEAEILTPEENAALDRRRPGTALVRRPVAHAARVVRGAYRVATHQRTKTTTRVLVRHTLAYPVAGLGVVVKRWRDAHGANRYERQMRAAEAAGDQEALRYWQEADVAEKQRRHTRVMDWVQAPGKLIRAGVITLLGLAGFLLLIGVVVAVNTGTIGDVIAPITAVVDAVAWLVWFLTAYGMLLLLGGTACVVAYLHHLGRTRSELPQWLTAPSELDSDAMDELPDEGTILNALRNLDIPGFTRALKEGWRIRFLMPPVIDGKGWRAQLALPPACTVEDIVRRKKTLAHNLVRFPIEVWPTEPQPSVLDLWVAKPGALSGPVDPWPLLSDLDTAQTDYFAGVPVGVTIRGDVVRGRLFEANYAVGGMMGSGKSTLVITLILGAMLDPLVDIDVVVMAENADYEPMKPRLRTLTAGAGEDTVDTCMTMISQLYDELALRGRALRQHDARAVTRPIAEKDDRLRPRILVVDECQNLFMGKHGKTAIETAAKLMSTARKYAITLAFLTPEPSKDALPRKILSITSNKACFAIGDQMGNDAVLGTGSYKSGISAVGLTPKTDEGPGDIGTCMARGFTPKPGLLRSFYVPQGDAHRVTQRALELRERTGIEPTTVDPPRVVDHLADIAQAMTGHERMRTQEVLHRLATHNPGVYRRWTFADLNTALPDAAKPYKTQGVMQVSRARVVEAITERDSEDLAGDGEE